MSEEPIKRTRFQDRESLIAGFDAYEREVTQCVIAIDKADAWAWPCRDMRIKDVIAHLTAWADLTARKLELARLRSQPGTWWPPDLGDDTDKINAWIHMFYYDHTPSELRHGRLLVVGRIITALDRLPDELLFSEDSVAWHDGRWGAFGPALIEGMYDHWREEHEYDLYQALAKPLG